MLKQCFLEKLLAFCRLLHHKILYYRSVSPKKTHINASAGSPVGLFRVLTNEDKIKQTHTYLKEKKTRVTFKALDLDSHRVGVKTGTEFRKFSSISVEMPEKIIMKRRK